jgi:ATP-dependent DNA helicase RecG
MTPQEIRSLIEKGESETLEFKTSSSDIRGIIGTISAFANTKGGRILIGVEDSGDIKGITIGRKTIEDIANRISQSTDPKIYPVVRVEEIDSKKIIVISIKDTQNKPYLASGRAFRRVGKSTLKMSRDVYERMILEKQKEELRFDGQVCKKATLNDIDKERVKWYLCVFLCILPPIPDDTLPPIPENTLPLFGH